MRILLLGRDGQVGWELQRSLQHLGEVIALGRMTESGLVGDLSDTPGIRRTVLELKPDVVVNAAAYTAVDKAENEQALAYRINAEAVGVLAEAVADIGGWLVHYSTDYVFSGRNGLPWKESDTVDPVNFYGRSKLDGELAIQRSGCQHLIFRTSWVYGVHGANFVKTILRLAVEREVVKVVNDQIGSPTSAELIADVTAHAISCMNTSLPLSGVYHLAPKGEVSWYEYARYVVELSKLNRQDLKVRLIEGIASSDYPTLAVRPLNSRLDTSKICSTFNIQLPIWQFGVARMLSEIQGSKNEA